MKRKRGGEGLVVERTHGVGSWIVGGYVVVVERIRVKWRLDDDQVVWWWSVMVGAGW